MLAFPPQFQVRLAATEADRQAAARLRYRVFVQEMGADGGLTDHIAGLERDRFDTIADHLLLRDLSRPEEAQVVGVYRLMDSAQAARAGGFYCAGEYDLSPLLDSGLQVMELGRSCLDAAYRGGAGMFHLWQALAQLVAARGADLLFGVASFPTTDAAALAQPLAWLHHHHLAPAPLRPRARAFQAMDLVPRAALDQRAAMLATPALIKAYLRLGGVVGEGAYVDHAFNATDVFLMLDLRQTNPRARAIYDRPRRG
jgi:L-ornithine Nalpha-acyltransferase